jgi:hypothetical protein
VKAKSLRGMDFSWVSTCPLESACGKYYTGCIYFIGKHLSGDLRTLAGGFNQRKVTYLLLRLCEDSGNLTVDDGTMDFFLRRV